ncbi:MAG: carbonic anhydrase [Verrucomicrobia bacterium]|nr:carbonic anhydrase [Verrucomicrobiota bacterium]
MQPVLENLHHFRRETFGASRELLDRPSRNEPRSPALLVTCADAGLLAERLTEGNPAGFCFASGLGTFVPPANAVAKGDDDSLAATLDYAVRVLRVPDLVVCGHSRCCAMATLLRGSLPGAHQANLTWWLAQTAPLRDLIQSRYAHLTDNAERQRAAELESVLISLENLPTYPFVRERLDEGALRLHGWFFKTATGELFAFNPAAGQFELLRTFPEGRRA